MKAALIIHRLSRSGAPKIMVWLAEYLTGKGHDVTLISLYDCRDSLPVPPEVRLKELNIRQSGDPLFRKTLGLLSAEKRLLQV
ncbi:MAG: hypothetical protein J5758_00105, partial [Abditibacteriota bacterium]|nr:hypothetical protein [Abditibacteriota bacterium]